MKELANKIYDCNVDMDFADYEETKADDIQKLTEDLMLLKEHGNGTLLIAIKMLLENA